jgi:hypothetical protein
VLWPKIGHVGPTCQATRPCNLVGGQVSSLHHLWALDTLSTASAGHIDKMVFGNAPTYRQPDKVMWPASQTMAQLIPCFVPHIVYDYALFWKCANILSMTMPYFGHN